MAASSSEPPAGVDLRPLGIDDYDAVIDPWRRSDGVSLRGADSREGIARYLARNPGLSFAAWSCAELVGTILAGHDGKRGYIQHLAVDEPWRGRGIGGALVGRCIAALAAIGILKNHVHVPRGNAAGRAFWVNRGWFERDEIVMYSCIVGDDPGV